MEALLVRRAAADERGHARIRLVGPVAGAIVFVGYLVFRQYPLPDAIPARAAPMVPA